MNGVRAINRYNAIKVDKYKGKFSIVLGNEKENSFYADWRILSQWDPEKGEGVIRVKEDGSYYRLPTAIVLGESGEEVKATLAWIYEEVQKMGAPPLEDENVPF
jgi:hypothetical protein